SLVEYVLRIAGSSAFSPGSILAENGSCGRGGGEPRAESPAPPGPVRRLPFSNRSRSLVVQHERDLHVHAPLGDFVVFDFGVLLVDPYALNVLDGLRGTLEAFLYRVFEALRRRGRELDDLCNGHGGLLLCVVTGRAEQFLCQDAEWRLRQTVLSFQRPRRNRATLATAISDSAIAIAQKMPCGPIAAASAYASGSCSSQKNTKLIQVGVSVSPAPLNAWIMIMPSA